MDAKQFAELASQGYNRIPISLTSLADLDTPLSTYLKIAKGPYSYLLESSHGGEKVGALFDHWSALPDDSQSVMATTLRSSPTARSRNRWKQTIR